MGAPRHRRPTLLVAVASVASSLLLVLGGCGAANHLRLGAPPAPTTTVDPNADGGQAAAILAAYQGSLAAFNQVGTTAPVNPDDPLLAEHMDGHELSAVTGAFSKLASSGQVDSGALSSLSAHIGQYNGSQAVVVSCEKDGVAVLDAATKKVVRSGAASNSLELVNDLLTFDGGVWKVSQNSDVRAGCQ